MIFKALTLYTNNLENELTFYSEKLGFEVLSQNDKSFTIKIGWSQLSFEKSSYLL